MSGAILERIKIRFAPKGTPPNEGADQAIEDCARELARELEKVALIERDSYLPISVAATILFRAAIVRGLRKDDFAHVLSTIAGFYDDYEEKVEEAVAELDKEPPTKN